MKKSFFFILFFIMTTNFAHSFVEIDVQGNLSVESCMYGRGQLAVTGARDQGLQQLAEYLKGSLFLSISSDESSFKSTSMETLGYEQVAILEQQRDYIAAGNSLSGLTFDTSQPKIMGNDTCVTVTLKAIAPETSQGGDGGQNNVTVVVSGEGYPHQGETATERAERDALRRAVSQVVGVWLTEQRSQSSTLNISIQNDSEQTQMTDLMTNQLTSRSEGFVSKWELIDSKKLHNNGVNITIRATVDRKQIVQLSESLLKELGSPRIKVSADTPLNEILVDWLSMQGISTSQDAVIIVNGISDLRRYGNNRRLIIRISVEDTFGNSYGRWENDPSLISLPDSPNILEDLIKVHLSTEEQRYDLDNHLRTFFVNIFRRGGLLREFKISSDLIDDSSSVRTVVSTLAGISDVSMRSTEGFHILQLRYPGPTDQLATALSQGLMHVNLKSTGSMTVIDDSLIIYQ